MGVARMLHKTAEKLLIQVVASALVVEC